MKTVLFYSENIRAVITVNDENSQLFPRNFTTPFYLKSE